MTREKLAALFEKGIDTITVTARVGRKKRIHSKYKYARALKDIRDSKTGELLTDHAWIIAETLDANGNDDVKLICKIKQYQRIDKSKDFGIDVIAKLQ